MKNEAQIIRRDLDGSYIKKTVGSLGYQVFFKGKFIGFFINVMDANGLLDAYQRKAA